ncbi:hypothetical protein [Hyalangium minutum]|uniref:hypothetical protein n=1 Tax=Hyalangium minutum TaxID=394096 RepID=UPI0005C62AEC|nr:hypothetical protein [Hyalangium minutum]
MRHIVPLFCVAALLSIMGCTDNDPDTRPDAGPTVPDAGPDGGSTADGGVDASREYCQALCTHRTACDPQNSSDFCNASACTARAGLYLDAARSSLRTCLTASCSVSEDDCFTQVADAMPTRAADETFRTHCASRQAACAGDLPSSLCASTNGTELLVETAVQRSDACLAGACAQILDCVIEAWGGPK